MVGLLLVPFVLAVVVVFRFLWIRLFVMTGRCNTSRQADGEKSAQSDSGELSIHWFSLSVTRLPFRRWEVLGRER